MTYEQAKQFCKKDNATIPYIKNIYWYHTLTQYLESQQEDWRYYDMVWVSDLDAPEDHCKVFVDGSVERVSCDFLLPTLCEMDEHVNLSVDFLKSEFVIAIGAAVLPGSMDQRFGLIRHSRHQAILPLVDSPA